MSGFQNSPCGCHFDEGGANHEELLVWRKSMAAQVVFGAQTRGEAFKLGEHALVGAQWVDSEGGK